MENQCESITGRLQYSSVRLFWTSALWDKKELSVPGTRSQANKIGNPYNMNQQDALFSINLFQ